MINTQTNVHESSTIDSTSYNYMRKELVVTFKSGTAYLYKDVPTEVYKEFRDSDSHGKAFSSLIKQNKDISFEKLED